MAFPRRPKHRWPRKLVGDTPGLRARFRREHPDTPISVDRHSRYRTWLNAKRRPSRQRVRRPGSRPIRNQLLQHAFLLDIRAGLVPSKPTAGDSRSYDFFAWLRAKGIDPDTGRMTLAGFAFFKSLLDADRDEKSSRRHRAA